MKIAFVTAPPQEANSLARRAVESGVAACVNVVPGITSHYRWQGEHHADGETLLIAKISEEMVTEFIARIREWHSHSCPEVVVVDVTGGNADYISWVESSSRNVLREEENEGSM